MKYIINDILFVVFLISNYSIVFMTKQCHLYNKDNTILFQRVTEERNLKLLRTVSNTE